MIKCKMKYIIILFVFLLIPLVFAETTFFDNHPDDAFIMGDSSATGEVIEGTTGGTTGGGGCLTNWSCSSWSSCIGGIQIRNCTKEKPNCYADLKKKPIESQTCSIKTEDNKESEEGINNFTNEDEGDNDNLNSSKVKIIILGLVVIISIGFITFFFFKKHRKKRYSN